MAVDYFLKLGDITGESASTHHVGEIEVLSWSWGGTQTSTVSATTGSGGGKVSLSDLNLMIQFDMSSAKLLKGLTIGTHYPKATLAAQKSGASGGSNYMTFDLTEVYIASLQLSASGDIPSCSLSLTYKSYTFNYFQQKADGTVTNAGTAGYDVTTNVTT